MRLFGFFWSPVTISNLATPCILSAALSAGAPLDKVVQVASQLSIGDYCASPPVQLRITSRQ